MPAYLFDIGNVIIRFDFGLTIARLAPACDLPADEMRPAVADLTRAFELGEMDTPAFLSQCAERLGYEGSLEDLEMAFADIFTLNQPIVDFIESRAQAGHPLFLLSNTNAIHVPFFTSTYPVFSHFHGATYSHLVGAMKPDSRIYEAAIAAHDLDPARTIYVDDLEANIVEGKAHGLQAIHYHHEAHERFLAEHDALLAQLSG